MKNRCHKFIILFLCLGLFNACSYFSSIGNLFGGEAKDEGGTISIDSENKNLNGDKTEGTAKNEDFFTLRVLEKVNDGDRLYVLGDVEAKDSYDIGSIIIKLKLIDRNFQVVSEHPYIFSHLLDGEHKNAFKKGESKKFLISAPLKNATDFQMELLWGNEAFQEMNKYNMKGASQEAKQDKNLDASQEEVKQEMQPNETNDNTNTKVTNEEKKEVLKLTNLYFKENLVSGSSESNPEYYFTITGEFQNLSNKPIKEIAIGVSFKGIKQNGKLEGDEEILEIKDVNLKAFGNKKFEMELETVLSKDEVENYKPDIRVINFSY